MGRMFFELGENRLFWGFSPVHIPQESERGGASINPTLVAKKKLFDVLTITLI